MSIVDEKSGETLLVATEYSFFVRAARVLSLQPTRMHKILTAPLTVWS